LRELAQEAAAPMKIRGGKGKSPRDSDPDELVPQERDRSDRKSAVRDLTWAEFDPMVQALARKIKRTFRPDAVVGVAHGGVFVGGAIAGALGSDFYAVRISRRSRDQRVRKSPRLFGKMPKELKGKRVLVVDDVAASGETLKLACALALKVGAKEVSTACLVAQENGYQPGWTSILSDTLVVFPWDYEPMVEDGRFEVDPDKAGA
jgi:hypoxanthine phosphoribosyltransferase